MPRIAFKSENKVTRGGPTFDKLKLKTGESVRLVAGLEEPQAEFVHVLRKPKVENGKFVKETKPKRDGGSYTVIAKDFVGQFLCTGDPDVLDDNGSDPKGCKACAAAATDPERFDAPTMKYALNVFRYATKKGTAAQVATPFSGQVVQWVFTPNRFNTLVDIVEESGPLKEVDIILGPCEDENFQKYQIKAGSSSAWNEDAEKKKFVLTSFKENKRDDIDLAIAQRKEERWISKDIGDVNAAWDLVQGKDKSAPEDDADLDADLEGILSETQSEDTSTEVDVDDIMGGDEEKPKAKSKAKTETAEVEDEEDDFNDPELRALMADLED